MNLNELYTIADYKDRNGMIFNCDCLDLMSKMDNKSVDLILTDIPYNISKENNFQTMKDRTGRNGLVS